MTAWPQLSPEDTARLAAQVRERPVPPPVGERARVEVVTVAGQVLVREPEPDEALS
jgi:hypothetical protein